MSEHKTLSQSDFTMKQGMTNFKKIGGRVVEESISPGTMDDDDFMDTLMGEVDTMDIEEGKEAIANDPRMSANSLQVDASYEQGFEQGLGYGVEPSDVAASLMSPVRIASTKRFGKLQDEQGDCVLFKRVANNMVTVTEESGEVIATTSSMDFNELLESGTYTVL